MPDGPSLSSEVDADDIPISYFNTVLFLFGFILFLCSIIVILLLHNSIVVPGMVPPLSRGTNK